MMKFDNYSFLKKIILCLFTILLWFGNTKSWAQRLIGTTHQGGTSGWGVLFEMNTATGIFSNLYNFQIGSGVTPYQGVIQASDGFLYGMTSGTGGAVGFGTIFKVANDGSGYTMLHNFNTGVPNDGQSPYSKLLEHSNGDLYGTTSVGGANGSGMIFRIRKDGTNYQVLYSFGDTASDGINPIAGLIEDSTGKIFGTTAYGVSGGRGIVFSINADGSGYSILKPFTVTADGSYPIGGLLLGSDDNLYGMCRAGGNDDLGTIFQLSKDGGSFQVVHQFDNTTGIYPSGILIEVSNQLFGLTTDGGANNLGTAFSCNLDGTAFSVLHDFDGTDGANPAGSLVYASDNLLYGTTRLGGTSNEGIIFSLTETGTFNKLYDFQGTAGQQPYYVQLVELNMALPVELSGFDAAIVGKDVQLSWTTESEINNKGFTIQKSKDGEHWENIDFVVGNNNSTFSQQYFYKDKNPFPGSNYYRLQQEDFDGKKDWSAIRVVSFLDKKPTQINPNPTQEGQTQLEFFAEQSLSGWLKIVDVKGQVFLIEKIEFEKGWNQKVLDVSQVPRGIYFVQIELGDSLEVKKIVIE